MGGTPQKTHGKLPHYHCDRFRRQKRLLYKKWIITIR